MRPLSAVAFDALLVAVGGAPERLLDGLVRQAYSAQIAGLIDEAQCEVLHQAAHSRRAVFGARRRRLQHPVTRAGLPTRRDDRAARRANRRVWSGSGALPHHLRALFTPGENAVAAVVRAEVRKHGACALTYGAIAKAAGLEGVTVVKRFVRQAKKHNLIDVELRPQPGRKNLPNVITITDADWLTWNALSEQHRGHEGASIQRVPSKNSRTPSSKVVAVVRLHGLGRRSERTLRTVRDG